MIAGSEKDFKATGKGRITEDDHGWSFRAAGNALVAQFEHTILVSTGEPLILTL